MARKSARRMSSATKVRRILAIDVGGTGLKAAIVSPKGKFLSDRQRVKTPHKCRPHQMVEELSALAKVLGAYDHISIGFPGYVRNGKVITAPHFGTDTWSGFPLAAAIAKKLGAPTRLTNDADIQGLAAMKGKGLELVCTLGTGFGTAWFRDGELMPHMDLAHFTVKKKDDLDRYLGDETRKKIGHGEWNKRVAKVIAMLATVMNYDRLYLGGGNSRHVKFKLPRNVFTVSNDAGMEGSAFVWRRQHRPA